MTEVSWLGPDIIRFLVNVKKTLTNIFYANYPITDYAIRDSKKGIKQRMPKVIYNNIIVIISAAGIIISLLLLVLLGRLKRPGLIMT